MSTTQTCTRSTYHARIERVHNWIGEYLQDHPNASRQTVEALALAQGRLSALMALPHAVLAELDHEGDLDISLELETATDTLVTYC